MKTSTKLLSFLLILIANFSWAQSPIRTPSVLYPAYSNVNPIHPSTHGKTRDSYSKYYLDYPSADYDGSGFLWPINSSNVTDTGVFTYAAVAFTQVAGFIDDASSPVIWSDLLLPNAYPKDLQLSFDTLLIAVTQENNSGQGDIIKADLVKVKSDGSPSTNPADVVWSESDTIFTSLSPSGEWLGANAGFTLAYAPNLTTDPGEQLALVFHYFDPSGIDSLGLTADFLDDGTGTVDNPNALRSNYPTSFLELSNTSFNTPTLNSSLVYGGTSHPILPQNWVMIAQVHFAYTDTGGGGPSGVKDITGNISSAKLLPSLANQESKISFSLAKSGPVNIDVLDLNGKIISNVFAGNMASGKQTQVINTQNLANGLYMVSLSDNSGGRSISKLVVSR